MYQKFIITDDGVLKFGHVYLHRDMLPIGDDDCHGGGLWKIDHTRNAILLFGHSALVETLSKNGLLGKTKQFMPTHRSTFKIVQQQT